jgi:23S rRNA pseudouridine2605 synthase
MAEERLQKILARAGIASRRAAEQFIAAGRVTVNGRVADLGSQADPQRDKIFLDGRPVQGSEELVYVAIYKPRGVLSTVSAPDARPPVVELVDLPQRLYPVGRLDVDSEGLMLLTNDGEMANRLTHPRFGHEKEYRVLVARRPDLEQLEKWRRGIVLEDGYRTEPARAEVESTIGKGAWLRVVLKEGRKRQIREMGALTGLPVVRIIRVRIGTLRLGTLKPREWRRLSAEELDLLKGKVVAEPERGSTRNGPRRPGKPSGKSAGPGSRPGGRQGHPAGGRSPMGRRSGPPPAKRKKNGRD